MEPLVTIESENHGNHENGVFIDKKNANDGIDSTIVLNHVQMSHI